MADATIDWAENLPDLCVLLVFSKLDAKSLCEVAKTCRTWNQLGSTDDAWRCICGENEILSASSGLKEIYRDWHTKFHKIHNFQLHHRRLKRLYKRLTAWLDTHAPAIAKSLNPGCSLAEIERVETMTNEFTPDFRVWYMLLNGQKRSLTGPRFGLLGGYQFYDYACNFRLLEIDEVSDLHSMINSSRSRVPEWVTKTVPVAQSFNAAVFWFMLKDDLSFPEYPGVTFKKGSIVVPSRNMRSCFPVAETITALLEHHLEQLENEFLTVDAKGEIQRFATKGLVEAVTNHVRIRVSPLFIPDQSAPGQSYTWSYRIFMDMAPDAPNSATCQLTTRTWQITDATGKTETVHGPGVIGLFPKMHPGAKFSYESCCPLATTTGTMEGSFQMAMESTGEEFDAEVPQFKFAVPEIIKEKPCE